MTTFTNAELAILGLLGEGPKHGYQLEQLIVMRGMREWTEIAFSSIYSALNRLETGGWLSSALETPSAKITGRGPARRVYQLTAAGRDGLREAVRERLAQPRPRSADFDLALANLPVLSRDAARAALLERRDTLREDMAGVRAKALADKTSFLLAGQGFPPHVAALFEHALALMQADLDWLEGFLAHDNAEGHDDQNGLEKGL